MTKYSIKYENYYLQEFKEWLVKKHPNLNVESQIINIIKTPELWVNIFLDLANPDLVGYNFQKLVLEWKAEKQTKALLKELTEKWEREKAEKEKQIQQKELIIQELNKTNEELKQKHTQYKQKEKSFLQKEIQLIKEALHD